MGMIGEKNYGGELLGPFRLVAECGCGPAGCVYQARPISMARPSVAIKWFHTVRLSPHQCRQFLLAVRLLKKLKHPHILPLLDAGIAMEGSHTSSASTPPTGPWRTCSTINLLCLGKA